MCGGEPGKIPGTKSEVETSLAARLGAGCDIIPPDRPNEQLAKILHYEFERLDPSDQPAWDSLSDHQRRVYLLLIEELLGHRDLVLSAIPFPDHSEISRRT